MITYQGCRAGFTHRCVHVPLDLAVAARHNKDTTAQIKCLCMQCSALVVSFAGKESIKQGLRKAKLPVLRVGVMHATAFSEQSIILVCDMNGVISHKWQLWHTY